MAGNEHRQDKQNKCLTASEIAPYFVYPAYVLVIEIEIEFCNYLSRNRISCI